MEGQMEYGGREGGMGMEEEIEGGRGGGMKRGRKGVGDGWKGSGNKFLIKPLVPVLPAGGSTHLLSGGGPLSLRDTRGGDSSAGWGGDAEGAGRHVHGEVGDEGFLGQLHLEGGLLHGIRSVDHPAGDDRVGKPGGDPGVHSEAVDVDGILGQ